MYASLFEHNPDSIISLNLEGVILHINPSAERILGYTSLELEQKNITSILEAHISEQVLQNIKNTEADNQQEYILSIYHKNGFLLDFVTKLVPIFVQNRLTGVYAIMKPHFLASISIMYLTTGKKIANSFNIMKHTEKLFYIVKKSMN